MGGRPRRKARPCERTAVGYWFGSRSRKSDKEKPGTRGTEVLEGGSAIDARPARRYERKEIVASGIPVRRQPAEASSSP